MNNLRIREATPEEVLERYSRRLGKRRVGFEIYTCEFSDGFGRTYHRRRNSSFVRDYGGTAFVKNHGKIEQLYASHFTFDDGVSFVACATIIKPEHRG